MPLHRNQSERAFQNRVLQYAAERGWIFHHCTDSRRCKGNRGFPDVFFARNGRVLMVEFKSEKGTLSKWQHHWFRHLPEGYIWKPEDWAEIKKILE